MNNHVYRLLFPLLFLTYGIITPTTAQDRTVSGTITSELEGEPLPGATVLVKGTTIGASADINGNYRLSIPTEATTLIFSFVGYETVERNIGDAEVIDASLAPDLETLGEVVVVGYGTQQKRDLTSSISSVDSEALSKRQVAGLDQALQGQAPGVFVTQNSGSPGGSVSVKVRGLGTIGNSDPLYVVDGVPYYGNLNSINPQDIESIDIAKDAASGAIYGANAANGIVFITTKRGEAGKTSVDFNTYVGVQQQGYKVPVLTAQEYAILLNESRRNAGLPIIYSNAEINDLGFGTDWQDEVFRNATIQNYGLNISGGSERSTFLVSGNYFKQQGIIIGSDYERYNLRLNSDHEVSDRITFGTNININRSERQGINENDEFNSIPLAALVSSPVMRARNPDGSFAGPTGAKGDSDTRNPVSSALTTENTDVNWVFFGNAFTEVDILDGLTYRLNTAYTFNYGYFSSYQPRLQEDLFSVPIDQLGEGTYSSGSFLLENILMYDKVFGRHTISALAGFTLGSGTGRSLSASGQDFLSPRAVVIDNADPNTIRAQGSQQPPSRGMSVLSRLNYEYDDRYFISATVRRDGSSNFGPNNRYGTFPGVSAGWRIAGEDFFNVPLISDLKLRASWGQLGNSSIRPFGFIPLIGFGSNYVLGSGQRIVTGAAPLFPANENIQWETTTTTNFAVDLGLLEDRLSFTAEYYIKESDDILLQKPLPLSSGYQENPPFNVGKVNNYGLELAATYRKNSGSLTYSIGANFSTLRNEVLDLGGSPPIASTFDVGGFFPNSTRVGSPISAFYGYVADGIFQNQGELDAHATQEGAAPGDIRFRDISGPEGVPDGVIDGEDRQVIGNPLPDYAFGLNAQFSYAGFDLNFLVQGVYGNDIYNATRINLENFSDFGNKHNYIIDRWTGPGTSDRVPRLIWTDPNNNFGRSSSYFVEDGSYVRLKNVQLGYNLPGSVLERVGITHARVYVSGENLITLTRYSGYDPEIGSVPGTGGQGTDESFRSFNNGVDIGNYPIARSFTVGVNFGF